MKHIKSVGFLGALAAMGLASCSPSYTAMTGETDDLYFMASDAAVATEYAVQGNNAANFREIRQEQPEALTQENFSAKNVNPEYIARYQRQEPADTGSIYFDEAGVSQQQEDDGDINVYNNFYGGNNNFNRGGMGMMNPWMGGMGMMNPWMMDPWMMGGMGMMNPWMGGMGMMNPWMMDPWMMGMRPGFGMSVGMGMGWGMGPRFGMGFGFGNPWMMGSRFGMMGMGMGMWGMHPMGMWGMHPMMGWGGFGRPIYVLPGGEFGQRAMVRGPRATRGGGIATPSTRATAATPTASRAAARRDAVSRTSPTSTPSSRVRGTDFNRTQNELYSDRSRTAASASPSRRAVNSPAMNRAGSANSRSAYTAPRNTSRTAPASPRAVSPSNRNVAPSRGASPSYNRRATPSRSGSPTYNRATSPQRYSPAQRSAPAQRSTPSYSPSRGGSMGGGSRGGGSVGGSRGGGGRGGEIISPLFFNLFFHLLR